MDGNEFYGDDSVLSDDINIVGEKSFNYSLGDMNCASSHLCFFESPRYKTASDFLYYGWPDIGNFEDVDRIFRSCDSTFGLGGTKEDELHWLSSADNLGLGRSADILKSDVKFPCPEPNVAENMSENHASMDDCSIDDSTISAAPIRSKDGSWISEEAFVIEPATGDCKDGFIHHEQLNEHKMCIKRQKQSVEEGKGYSSQNELPSEVMQPPGLSYHQPSPYVNMQCLSQRPKSDISLNPVSTMHSDNNDLSDLTSVNLKPSAAKFDDNDLCSFMPTDSFSTGSQLQYADGASDNSLFEVSALAMNGQSEKLQRYLDSQSSVNSTIGEGSVAMIEPGPVRNHGSYDISERVSLVNPAELGSLNVQENLTTTSRGDDLSPEGASFRQLQLVMEQLDLQTKLCIRDGLYRLARNANKRNSHANLSTRCGDGRESTGDASVPEETTSFTDMETGTNLIDRSIAHLLFHQHSDSSSTTPAHNSFPTMVCSK